jgi:hypothetical protein
MQNSLKKLAGIALWMAALAMLVPAAQAAQIGPAKFDHLTTGFELMGAHLNVPCESCHVGAIFKGTPRDCASCHSRGARVTATFKPQNHVLSTDRCDSCHSDVAWNPVSHFDHQEVQGSCATCHNGVTATGKPATHIATTNECAACHSVFGWNPVISVDHTQVNGTCMSCHNGSIATGKPANHLPTTDSCDNCHSTLAWKPANFNHTGNISNCVACHNGVIATGKTPTHMTTTDQCAACHSVVVWKPQLTVDHTQVIGACFSCHNGVIADTKPANHPVTDNTCENCHATTAWLPANVNHNGITSNCVACHNNTIATGKPSNHITTSDACQACHSVLVWKPQVTVDHTQVLGACASCHNGSIALGRAANHIPAAADCGVCHLSTVAFGPGTVMNHTGIVANCASCHETGLSWLGVTIVTRPTKAQDASHPTTGDCSQCHSSTVSFTVDVSGGKPVNHIPTSQTCSLCHGDPGDFSIYKMNHTGITSNCSQCHAAGLSFANIVPKEPNPTHIPIAGLPCENCHSPTNFGAFGPGTAMNHTGISSNCASCHETGDTWYGVTMVDRPTAAQDPVHPASGDCSQCHSSTTSFSIVSAGKPANHIPTAQACTLCHTNANNFAIYTMNHAGITNNCAQCHAAGLSFANIVPKAPPANHIPIVGLPCENCHSPTNFGAFGPGTAMSHAGIAGNCASCHELGLTWYGVTMVDRPTAAQDSLHPATGECSNCHSSTVSFSQGITGGNKPVNHIPTTQVCTLCHTVTGNFAVYTMNHTGITGNCAQCHAAGLTFANITPKEPPPTHLPIGSLPCENCHSPGLFTAFGPGTAMSHTGITGNCASCHETGLSWYGVSMVDRPTAAQDANHPATGECSLCHGSTVSFTTALLAPANHIPTTQPCALCHTNTANYAVYTMSHAGITSNCAQCHASGLSFANIVPKEPPPTHIPSTTACENCHSASVFTAFGPGTPMSHTNITSNCASCHETGDTWFGVTMVDRPTAAQDASHPKTGDCSQCHTSTVSFSQGVTTKPANHIPTSQPCTLCHTNANDFSIYTMSHSGITNNCIQCHGSLAGISFANIVPTPSPPTHIPTASIACESCHSITVFTSFSGTKMNHTPVAAMTCESCHETGDTWFGVKMVDRPKGHHAGQDCKGCHQTTSFNAGNAAAAVKPGAGNTAKIQAVTAAPATMSKIASVNGSSTAATATASGNAAGAAAAATPTANKIANTGGAPGRAGPVASAAGPSRFNLAGPMANIANRASINGANAQGFVHVGTRRDCATCHNGLVAVGKGFNHVASDNNCGNCHTTTAWTPARFEHRGINLNCATCHDSVHATGKPAQHVQTSLACNTCHSTLAWSPAIFRHTGITAACQTCHNGMGTTGKSAGHMVTSLDCASCHNTMAWTPVLYRHTGAHYPGDHRVELNCVQCHTSNTQQIPWPSPANAPDCAGCHERNYQPGPHTKYGNVKYTAHELSNCAGACHVYSDETQKSIVKLRPGPQHQVSSGQF